MSLLVYGESDIGFTRRRNEDAIAWRQSNNGRNVLAILADGIGGQQGGDIASKTAVDTCMKQLSPLLEQDNIKVTELIDALNSAVSEANCQVRSMREQEESLSRMGTTLLVLWVLGDEAFIANVGDSRCYRLSADTVKQMTKDDTVAQAMVDDGSITESEIPRIPFRNVLTKAVGTEPEVLADIQQIFISRDDILILCSDGLTGAVDAEKWPSIISQEKSIKHQVECLIDESINNKANDNVSVIMVRRQ
ncbi:PP2C family protein-serine/threonine phosphatase [Alkalimarinus sediminis]|uniref:Protein phosphatase 2C domain-containing protein n=1 Tax=Alkalimarinus sediminis TaxID=1632866 RepID=A0A9E8HG34_9ALTE|nr:protein phosphatase 2C domain-containing protein [Alkalimarinus sediminis]UZW73585.1 protein phosphatase 2C domain-containing protein [Alkalimarinus sediminis]